MRRSVKKNIFLNWTHAFYRIIHKDMINVFLNKWQCSLLHKAGIIEGHKYDSLMRMARIYDKIQSNTSRESYACRILTIFSQSTKIYFIYFAIFYIISFYIYSYIRNQIVFLYIIFVWVIMPVVARQSSIHDAFVIC